MAVTKAIEKAIPKPYQSDFPANERARAGIRDRHKHTHSLDSTLQTCPIVSYNFII